MADILDELRHFAKGGAGDVSATCSDAVKEIERLRAAFSWIKTLAAAEWTFHEIGLVADDALSEHEGTEDRR